jgi:hypothetical protein
VNLTSFIEIIVPFYSVYFDLGSASVIVLYSVLLDKLGNKLSAGYFNWFCSYLTRRPCYIRFPQVFLSRFIALSAAPQCSVLRPLLWNKPINNLRSEIKHCCFLPYADNI